MSPSEETARPETENGAPAERKRGSRKGVAAHAGPVAPVADPVTMDAEWQREFFKRYRVEQARVPRRFAGKTLQNFKGTDRTRKDLVEAAQLFVQGFNFERGDFQGLLMEGPVGCGKSHLAVAILREVVGKGYSGLYYNSPDLLRDIRATFNDQGGATEDDLIDEVTEVDLLVLDDLGAEKISDFVLDRFYLIINKRYEGCKPLIVTTNLTQHELSNRLGDRVVSRLAEMCQVFGPFPNEDYRRRQLGNG